ncbi:TrkH family potassium uptake protein [Mumia sp. zg.B53]|nr:MULTISPECIES: potassium transporter TrkG [unclassified Mumia]MBW9206472.1 TrkH family potassium uptake protein [Mumia sp. zg.B17]MBW9211238.1 TrkH family potassium uptake protein [Mumia sp. zg.B21]MBW9215813.1 TrkH family potassium uptake protein [Mumia sp. zg.B53]MDD9348706.1 potassium transporter TrkG [Mumia sp.]
MSGMLTALAHPVRILPATFVLGSVAGTLLLLLPGMRTDGQQGGAVLPAAFTSVSAVTVTGLSTVDVSSYWTPLGQVVILVLVQVGGFGFVTLATILGVVVGGRIGLRSRLATQMDLHLVNLGEVIPLVRRILVTMLGFEAVVAVVLTFGFESRHDEGWGEAIWHGIFYSVMAFNNAGFALAPDSLVQYVGDAALILPISIAVFVGAVGFPVLAELSRRWRRPDRWSIHTKLTVWGSFLLLGAGTVLFGVVEWSNPATMGGQSFGEKLVTSFEGGIMPRSGGFNSIDYGEARSETTLITTIMMFIGGGSASTAGGIKITTFLLLGYVILAEVRGDPDVTIGSRRIGVSTLRQALTVALLAVMLVVTSTLALLVVAEVSLDEALFEATSAFATAGLSMGVTGDLPPAGQAVLMFLMLIGRVGTVATASALALRARPRRFHLPEERPIIG